MITTNKYYDRLIELKNQFPELTFDNDGYEYLRKEVQEKHKEQIEEVSQILKETIEGFTSFNNFKPRKDGSFLVRCQHNWDESFVGVGYFGVELFKEFEID
jgi:hypothetical protein